VRPSAAARFGCRCTTGSMVLAHLVICGGSSSFMTGCKPDITTSMGQSLLYLI
jgi:hypothetical protein